MESMYISALFLFMFILKMIREKNQENNHKQLSQRLHQFGANCLYNHSMQSTNQKHIKTCTHCGYTKNLKRMLRPRLV